MTSNAGFSAREPSGRDAAARRRRAPRRPIALLDLDVVARRRRRVERRLRRGDDERDAGPRRGERQRVRADLVGDVAVGGDAVGADDDGVGQTRGRSPTGRRRRRRCGARCPAATSSNAVSRAPCSSGRVSSAVTDARCPRSCSARTMPERRPPLDARQPAGVAVRVHAQRLGRTAPPAAPRPARPAPGSSRTSSSHSSTASATTAAAPVVGAGDDPPHGPRQVDGRRPGGGDALGLGPHERRVEALALGPLRRPGRRRTRRPRRSPARRGRPAGGWRRSSCRRRATSSHTMLVGQPGLVDQDGVVTTPLDGAHHGWIVGSPACPPARPVRPRRRGRAEALADRTGVERHDVAVVLGSGWGRCADALGAGHRGRRSPSCPGSRAPSAVGHGAGVRSIDVAGQQVLVFLGRSTSTRATTPPSSPTACASPPPPAAARSC